MLLVDAYNVLHAPGQAVADLDLRSLAGLLESSRYARVRRRLVCDGRPLPADARRHGWMETLDGLTWGRLGTTELVFSGRALTADDLIEDALRDRASGVRYLVVSSDKRLVRAAGRAGADSVRSATFLGQVVEDAHRHSASTRLPKFVSDVPLDPYSIASWMREFGIDPSTPDPERAREVVRDSRRAYKQPSKAKVPATREKQAQTTSEKIGEGVVSPEPIDPLLARAFEEWRDKLDLTDLDMKRWLPDVTPLRSRPPAPDR